MAFEFDKIPFMTAKSSGFTHTAGRKPTVIVLHCTQSPRKQGSARGVAHFFQTEVNPTSAHFIVDDNEVIRAVADKDIAYHCKGLNTVSIGIEHCGWASPGANADDWASDSVSVMLELSAQLSAELCKRYEIPIQQAKFKGPVDPTVEEGGFVQHKDAPAHGSHTDISPDFPMDRYLERVKFYFDGGEVSNGQSANN